MKIGNEGVEIHKKKCYLKNENLRQTLKKRNRAQSDVPVYKNGKCVGLFFKN